MRKINYKKISSKYENMVAPSNIGMGRSSLGDQKVEEYFYIDTNDLIPFKKQARKVFNDEELKLLAESIKLYGIRQPLTIIASLDNVGKYEVISGERRLKAAKLINLEKVPCIIIDNYQQAEEIALIENLHREDLHPVELGDAFFNLIKNKIYSSQTEIAKSLSFGETKVSELLQLSKLDKEVKEYLIKNNIRAREKLRKILKFVDNVEEQKKFLGLINKEKNLTKKNMSVLRIFIKDGLFQIQESGILRLNQHQREELNIIFKNLINKMNLV